MVFNYRPYARLSGVASSLFAHILLVTSFFFLLSAPAFGESIPFEGLDLPVDGIEEAGGEQLAIHIGGQQFLTTKEKAGRYVAGLYVQKPELRPRLSVRTYGLLVAKLVSSKDKELAGLAVEDTLTSTSATPAEVAEFLAIVSSADGGEQVVFDRMQDALRDATLVNSSRCLVLTFLGQENLRKVANQVSSTFAWARDSCLPFLLETASTRLSRLDVEGSARIVQALIDGIGENSIEVQQIQQAIMKIRDVLVAADAGDLDTFQKALSIASNDVALDGAYKDFAPKIVAEIAQKELAAGRPASAVRVLAQLKFSLRNDTHHVLLLRALQRIREEDADVLVNEEVHRAVSLYSAKDEQIRERYLSILEGRVYDCASRGVNEECVAVLKQVVAIRPDPSVENDRLRRELANKFLLKGDKQRANGILGEVQTPIPLLDALGFRAGTILYTVGIFLLVGAFAGYFLFRRQLSVQGRSATEKEKEMHPSYNDLDGDIAEYRKCLAVLELEPGVNEAVIKNAFRNAVKSCHPDASSETNAQKTTQFIELTKTYERLLELHRKFGRP